MSGKARFSLWKDNRWNYFFYDVKRSRKIYQNLELHANVMSRYNKALSQPIYSILGFYTDTIFPKSKHQIYDIFMRKNLFSRIKRFINAISVHRSKSIFYELLSLNIIFNLILLLLLFKTSYGFTFFNRKPNYNWKQYPKK